MKRIIKVVSIFFAIMFWFPYQIVPQKLTAEDYLPKLNRIFELHEPVKMFHPVLEEVYPIAIVEEKQFYIYEPTADKKYRLVKQIPVTTPVPEGVKAAYPLQENDYKMTCVVTGAVFESLDGYSIIFHEFVHCAEFATVELQLKKNMEIYKRAMEKQDWMWELNYPFPYNKKEFVEIYTSMLTAINKNGIEEVKELRKKLRQVLSTDEYSYLTWVEWKEGFARWIENKVKGKFKLSENHFGGNVPFSRPTFYEGGSQFTELIYRSNPKDVLDLEKLYSLIKQ
jgi:hypothetical protein